MVNIPAMHSTTVVSARAVAIVLARTMAIVVSRSAAIVLAVAALAIALKRRGKNDAAAEALAAVAATAEGKKDATVLYNLGVVYKRLRKGEEALSVLRRAVALRPEHASAHFQIYNELVQRGEKAEAAKELDLFKLLQKATPDFQRME